eukprot:TRINITY_DN17231_c0_g1_i1.p1 TRINITY_DN17231_c0_g1~~TRINITY_DN17231_c0_g1_i1.p1  ORF type:complete len:318 (+),score=52.40 TRINITY_DN17231_c0_g1_i1:69-956(+)
MSALLMSPTRSGLSSPQLLQSVRSSSPPTQNRAGSMTREVRFRAEQSSPGPADYIKSGSQVTSRGASPVRSAVFGTSKREVQSPRTPAPGVYDSVSGLITAKGGSFGKSERQVSSKVKRNSTPGPASYRTAKTTLKKNGGSFGNSKRFSGPLNYANSDSSVPGPGHYGGDRLSRASSPPRSMLTSVSDHRSNRMSPIMKYTSPTTSSLSTHSPILHAPLSTAVSPIPAAPTLGEQAWFDFCQRCRTQGLTEEELLILSLETLKSLMQKVDFTDVVAAARVEVQWRQLRQLRPQIP